MTRLCDGGFELPLISHMEWEEQGRPIEYVPMMAPLDLKERPQRPNPWHSSVARADHFAAAIHKAALGEYPKSTYAKSYREPS